VTETSRTRHAHATLAGDSDAIRFKEFCMDKQNHNDIAAFPELFDGMEQFIEEQAAGIKRTSVILAMIALPAGMLIAWWLNRVA
jgi:hypothetical protein